MMNEKAVRADDSPDETDVPPYFRRAALLIAGGAALLRLILVVAGTGAKRFIRADTASYRQFAQDLPRSLWSPSHAVLADAVKRGPGYPLFLRLASPFGAHINMTAVVVAQCVLGGATVWMTIVLGRRLFGPWAGLIAGGLLAIDPVSIGHTNLVLSETLYTAALVLTLLLLEDAARRRSYGLAALAGACFAFSLLVRPTLLYVTPLLLVFFWAGLRSRRGLLLGLLSLAVACGPVMLWMARDHHVIGSYTFSTIQGINMFDYRAAGALAEEKGLTLDQARTVLYQRYQRDLSTTDLAKLESAKIRDGIKEIKRHPEGYVRSAAQAMKRTALGAGEPYISSQIRPSLRRVVRPMILVACGLILLVEYAFAVFGLYLGTRQRRWRALALLVVPAACYLAISAGPEMYARFRVPVAPMICILAGLGASHLLLSRRIPTDSRSEDDVQPAYAGSQTSSST
jgi:4-amino-4-deoxy-L-arabinose transferase-like glycosyltransferase